jgi:hypothetical protein
MIRHNGHYVTLNMVSRGAGEGVISSLFIPAKRGQIYPRRRGIWNFLGGGVLIPRHVRIFGEL